jgi:hypothetical protein
MGVPNIRIDPVSTGSLRAWLMKPMDFLPEDGPWLSSQDLLAGQVTPDIGWIRAECIAQSLEMALRDGLLDTRFREWVDAFRPMLDQFEQEWIDQTLEMDASLRARAIADDLAEYRT